MREYFQANVDGHEPQDLWWKPVPRWDLTDYTDYNVRMAGEDAAFWAAREKEGYRVAVELPELWPFFFDTENLRGWGAWRQDAASWPRISTPAC